MKSITTLLIAVACAVALPAAAQDTGSYTTLFVGETDFTIAKMDDGNSSVSGTIRGAVLLTTEGHYVLPQWSTGSTICETSGMITPSGTLEGGSSCTHTDSDGDESHTISTRDPGQPGRGTGTSVSKGGTGKYAGFDIACTYATFPLSGTSVAVKSDCEWVRHVAN